MTYKIIRYCKDDEHPEHKKVIKEGLTLAEAKEYCESEESHEKGVWFDGYTEE